MSPTTPDPAIPTGSAPANAPTSGPTLTRRAEYRQATIAEIKTLARRQLAEHGPGAVSLRAIARQMRTASSALYRYFASHDELISALCIDAYAALANALTTARDRRPAGQHSARMWAISHAYRRWALDNHADFALIFGTPVPGYHAPEQVTGPSAGQATAVPLVTYAAAVAAGHADPDRTQVPATVRAGPFLDRLLGDSAPGHPPRLAAITLNAYASLLGFLTTEIFGSRSQLLPDTDQLYRAHVHTVMLGMGYDPARIDTDGSAI